MASSEKDGEIRTKFFPQVPKRPGADDPVERNRDEGDQAADSGVPSLASDSALYQRIAKEVADFKSGSQSDNPRLELLREKYLSVQSEGPGDRWDGAPYLGLTHLENEGVVQSGNTRRASQFSKWTSREHSSPFPFDKSTANRLLRFLSKQPSWSNFNRAAQRISEIPDAYYFSLIQALESGHATHENLSFAAPGVYQCYRQSTLMPQAFVAGLLAVISVGEAIRTVEVHRFQQVPDADGRACGNGLPSIFEVYEGWMVKKSRQILIHAFDCVTRAFHLTVISNALSSPSDFSITNKPTKRNSKFQILSGIATGVVGQLGFYSVPTVYARLGDLTVEMPSEINAADSGPMVQAVLNAMKENAASSQAFEAMNMIGASALPELVRIQIETVRRQYRQQANEE